MTLPLANECEWTFNAFASAFSQCECALRLYSFCNLEQTCSIRRVLVSDLT